MPIKSFYIASVLIINVMMIHYTGFISNIWCTHPHICNHTYCRIKVMYNIRIKIVRIQLFMDKNWWSVSFFSRNEKYCHWIFKNTTITNWKIILSSETIQDRNWVGTWQIQKKKCIKIQALIGMCKNAVLQLFMVRLVYVLKYEICTRDYNI